MGFLLPVVTSEGDGSSVFQTSLSLALNKLNVFFHLLSTWQLSCLTKMATWHSSKVAPPPWQVPGVYCELLSLSLSRPGRFA